MLSNSWKTVDRLLICCSQTGSGETIVHLNPALKQLQQTLPGTQITLLAVQNNQDTCLRTLEPDSELQSNSLEGALRRSLSLPQMIQTIADRHFNAAIMFTAPTESPYALAYLCYLAGIPIRLGQSWEFGGGVLSTCVQPPIDPVPLSEYHLHLLKSANL